MPASNLRIENSALYNYIKYEILPTEFIEQRTSETLILNASTSVYYVDYTNYEPAPNSIGRGWVCFDDSTVNGSIVVDTSQEQSSKISVVGPTSYTVDYVSGEIQDPIGGTPTTVSYYWHYVATLDAWPGTNPPPLPVVAVDIDRSVKEGFQLGGGKKNVRDGKIHIFGSNKAERDDIKEVIHDALYNKNVPLKDFSEGNYLNPDGTYNTDFTASVLSTSSTMHMLDIDARNITNWADWSDLNRWRAVITFTYETYVEA